MATMTLTEVRQKLYNHDIHFFEYADLSGLDLSHLDMRGINAYRGNFSKCTCEETWFGRATLNYANFTGADLRYADFTGASLVGSMFVDAHLYGTHFDRAVLDDANFAGARDIPTTDHTLIGSLLFATAGEDIVKRAIASMVMVNYDYCWRTFAKAFLDTPLYNTPAIHEWVTQTFRPFPPLAGKLADTLAWAERVKQRIAMLEAQDRYERCERE